MAAVPLFGHRFPLSVILDTSDRSDYWRCHFGVFFFFFAHHLLEILSAELWQKNPAEAFISSKVVFPLTGTDLLCRSRGQDVPSRTFFFFFFTACPCDTKQTHTPCDNCDLRKQIMWQLLRLPGSLLCPAGTEMNLIFHIFGGNC